MALPLKKKRRHKHCRPRALENCAKKENTEENFSPEKEFSIKQTH